jgi:formylglycine-generating enzyme required for sulfatase activity
MPTEAEWEYAAKGGQKSRGCEYSGSNTLGDVAWYDENSRKTTHSVQTKQANELGLYDMSGNVWEWCSDWYGSYSSSSQTNPTGAVSGSDRVNRGGSWDSIAGNCRSSIRGSGSPSYRLSSRGFRFAL